MKLSAMITEMSIFPESQDPILGENLTRLIIVNEGAGAFFEINQEGSHGAMPPPGV